MQIMYTTDRHSGCADIKNRILWVKAEDNSIQFQNFIRILNWFDIAVVVSNKNTADIPKLRTEQCQVTYNGILYAYSLIQQIGRDTAGYERELDRLDSNSLFDKYAGLTIAAYTTYIKEGLPEGTVLNVLSATVTFGKLHESPMGDFKHITIELPGVQEPSWNRIQSIKNQLFGAEAFAVQVHPPESLRLVGNNITHLWVARTYKGESPIGFNSGEYVLPTKKKVRTKVQKIVKHK